MDGFSFVVLWTGRTRRRLGVGRSAFRAGIARRIAEVTALDLAQLLFGQVLQGFLVEHKFLKYSLHSGSPLICRPGVHTRGRLNEQECCNDRLQPGAVPVRSDSSKFPDSEQAWLASSSRMGSFSRYSKRNLRWNSITDLDITETETQFRSCLDSRI